jgi:hypothetical protein
MSMRRMTGACGLASVGIWLAIFPLYTIQPPASLYDGAATAAALHTMYEWLGTLSLAAMTLWLGVTLVANGLEGGAALDGLAGLHGHGTVRGRDPGDVRRAGRPHGLLQPWWMGAGRDRQLPSIALVPGGQHPPGAQAPDTPVRPVWPAPTVRPE